MCISPITIFNRATYQKATISPFKNTVPCSKCEECKDLYRSEWTTRVAFELEHLYKNNGCAVFLTFTYNDEHLPIYQDGNFSVPCFNRSHVLGFLDKLNTYCWRNYGKNNLKYFFVAEYGKNTRRPHYHGLFFLSSAITNGGTTDADVFTFVEKARQYWCEYGYMFPKFDARKNAYVDNHGSIYLKDGKRVTLRVRDNIAGSKYVAKYVCKDMSYYGRSDVSLYLEDKENKEKMKPYLPKHWQSKGIGYSIFKNYDFSDSDVFKSALNDGVFNPCSKEMCPLPSYVINKVIYKNVLSTKTSKPRYSDKTNKPLYDRELTDLGVWYYQYILQSRVDKTARKMAEVFQSLQKSEYSKEIEDVLYKHNFRPLQYKSFYPLALYKSVWCNMSDYVLRYYLSKYDGDIQSLFDLTFLSDFVVSSKDLTTLRCHSDNILFSIVDKYSWYDISVIVNAYNRKVHKSFFQSCADGISVEYIDLFNQKFSDYVFKDFFLLLCSYTSYCRKRSIERIKKNVQFRDNQDKTRFLFKYQYNKKLC